MGGKIVVGDGQSDPESIHWCSPEWSTDGAAEVFRARTGVAGIDLDPCPNPGSIPRVKARVNFLLSDGHDGLQDLWGQVVDGVLIKNAWVNSPFGRYYYNPVTQHFLSPKEVKERVAKHVTTGVFNKKQARAAVLEGYESHSIEEWIQKCADSSRLCDMDIIQFGPAATGTGWWQDIIEETAAATLFLKGRPKFELVDFKTMKVVSVGNSAPMDCAISLWTDRREVLERFIQVFHKKRGRVHVLDHGRDLLRDNQPHKENS